MRLAEEPLLPCLPLQNLQLAWDRMVQGSASTAASSAAGGPVPDLSELRAKRLHEVLSRFPGGDMRLQAMQPGQAAGMQPMATNPPMTEASSLARGNGQVPGRASESRPSAAPTAEPRPRKGPTLLGELSSFIDGMSFPLEVDLEGKADITLRDFINKRSRKSHNVVSSFRVYCRVLMEVERQHGLGTAGFVRPSNLRLSASGSVQFVEPPGTPQRRAEVTVPSFSAGLTDQEIPFSSIPEPLALPAPMTEAAAAAAGAASVATVPLAAGESAPGPSTVAATGKGGNLAETAASEASGVSDRTVDVHKWSQWEDQWYLSPSLLAWMQKTRSPAPRLGNSTGYRRQQQQQPGGSPSGPSRLLPPMEELQGNDVYALGVLLIELLLPFEGDDERRVAQLNNINNRILPVELLQRWVNRPLGIGPVSGGETVPDRLPL